MDAGDYGQVCIHVRTLLPLCPVYGNHVAQAIMYTFGATVLSCMIHIALEHNHSNVHHYSSRASLVLSERFRRGAQRNIVFFSWLGHGSV